MSKIVMLLGLAACGVPSSMVDEVDTGDALQEEPPAPYRFRSIDFGIEVIWERYDDGAVTFLVNESFAEEFVVGMAETRSNEYGWYGEDCGPYGGGCHGFEDTVGVLYYVDEIDAVQLGETTLFDGGDDGMGDVIDDEGLDRLSFVLWFVGGVRDGQCVIWGDDPSYYAETGCSEL